MQKPELIINSAQEIRICSIVYRSTCTQQFIVYLKLLAPHAN